MSLERAIIEYAIEEMTGVGDRGVVNVDEHTVSWVSGAKFQPGWERREIIIDGDQHVVTEVENDTTLKILGSVASAPNLNYVFPRIFPVIAPQGTDTPYIVYQRISTVFVNSLGGDSGLAQAVVQFSVYGYDYDGVKSAVSDLKAIFRDYIQGDSDEEMGDALWVQTSILGNERDFYEHDTKLYHSVLEVRFWYVEED